MKEHREKQAGDYSPREVEAAHRVLIELFQILGGFRDAMVIVGGGSLSC
jgi:hypothetical protein